MIASNPKMIDDGKVDYKIEQSKSQYVVNSLESFFEESMDSVILAFCINKIKTSRKFTNKAHLKWNKAIF